MSAGETRMEGIVKRFGKYEGWGFIQTAQGKDYFAHYRQIEMPGFKSLTQGERVSFRPVLVNGKPRAHNIRREKNGHDNGEATSPRAELIIHKRDNPFTPQDPISDYSRFSGRGTDLENGKDLIHNAQNVLVTGERGVGKSSFSNQLVSYVQGVYPPGDVLVIEYQCLQDNKASEVITGLTSVLESKLTLVNGSRLSRVSTEFEWNWFIKVKAKIDLAPTKIADSANNFSEIITQLLSAQAFKRVCIFVDEIDRLGADEDLASFFRAVSSYVRGRGQKGFSFLLTGITGTLTNMLKQHPSFGRAVAPINLDVMPDSELEQILHGHLEDTGIGIDPTVAQEVVRFANGFPNPVHLFGYHLYRYSPGPVIGAADLAKTLDFIVNDFRKEEFSELYASVNPPEYEQIVRFLAVSSAGIGGCSARQLASELSEREASVTQRLAHLKNRLHIVRQDDTGKYHLKDPLFRVYCQWLYGLK